MSLHKSEGTDSILLYVVMAFRHSYWCLSVQEHKKLLLWKLFLTLVIGSFGGTEKSSVMQVYLSILIID